MIKINLLAEKKQPKAAKASKARKLEGAGVGAGVNLMLAGIVLLGVLFAGGWWWRLNGEVAQREERDREAKVELERLTEIRKKGEEYTAQKELLAQKIDLITQLKKKQDVPVHIMDQVSRNLPDNLWLESVSASSNQVSISGKATTYNAVSNFYRNLNDAGFFAAVTLGKTYEVNEGVAFSLSCNFATATEQSAEAQG